MHSIIQLQDSLSNLKKDGVVGIKQSFEDEGVLDRDLVIIAAESLERTFYKNKNLEQLNLTLLDRNDLIDFTNIN